MKKVLLALVVAFGVTGVYAAEPAKKAEEKKPATIDCTKPANKNKPQCQKAPESKVKVEVKKPEKVKREAPAAVKKKAEAENAKK